jgi:PAS domain S-box-containing protein
VKHRLSDLLDIPRLQSALDSLYLSSKIPSAIIDIEGNVHTGSGWQDVCSGFHRVHPEARKRCIESDLFISRHIHEANPSVIYKCPHGLVDSATPIIIEGEHIGNVFTGQLFFEEPDLEYFRSQGRRYGFDEKEYIDAVKKVPVISEQASQANLAVIAHLTGMLAEMGLERMREKEAERRLRESEERYRSVFGEASDGIFIMSADGKIIEVNESFARMHGYSAVELMRMNIRDLDTHETSKMIPERMRRLLAGEILAVEVEHHHKDGHTFPLEVTANLISIGGEPFIQCFHRDITERRRAEENLKQTIRLTQVLLDAFPCVALLLRPRTREIIASNAAAVKVGAVPGARCYSTWGQREDPCPWCLAPVVWDTGKEQHLVIDDAGTRWDSHWIPVSEDLYMHFAFDITDQKRAETEKEKLQAQLQQAMKMEAIGRLAGGVAHDFNNLLTVITGYSELLLQKIGKESPMHREVEEIKRAGERAASLTQQLLAFSRKQIIEPKVVHLDHLVAETHKMLTRLIGENITLQATTGKSLGSVKIDPGQFQQILMNLVVNARDAMPGGGKIVIETASVDLDEGYCALHPYVKPGRFVMLAVSDTGTGMSDEVKAHIFEPFFTTKEIGSGTGLGLATTYGAVHQAGGTIEAHSEVGLGTTFKIYLPRVEEQVIEPVNDDRTTDLPGGTETVLIVEDESILRDLCVRILEQLGYRVLQARNGAEAIAKVQGYGDRIDLLLTDVVMPGMNGGELATQLVLHNPEMKVLFTSGYTEDVISHHGVLAEGVSFIGKPYTPSALARKIRGVLEEA